MVAPSRQKDRYLGNSLKAFALFLIATSIAATYFLDALAIDLIAFGVLFLGASVYEGSRTAKKWSLALMVVY